MEKKTKIIRVTLEISVDEDLDENTITVDPDDVVDGFVISRNRKGTYIDEDGDKQYDDPTINFKMHEIESLAVEVLNPT